MKNIQSSNKKSASKNNTSTSTSRSNKINNKSRMVGGGDCGYTYTPANGPCLGPHPANIVTPSCSTATAPVSADISSSAGLYMTQSGGGSKSNLKFSSNKNQNITDGMISLYSSLYGGSSGVLNKNNRVPLYHAMEIKSRYGNKSEYSHIGGGVFKGNVSQYKKILKSNLEKIRTMTSGGGKINVNNLNKDILVRFVGNKKSQTGGRVSFPIEYYGGDSGNYSAGNASSGGGVPVPRGSSGVVQTGGRVSFPIEYYGGGSSNYSAGNASAGGVVQTDGDLTYEYLTEMIIHKYLGRLTRFIASINKNQDTYLFIVNMILNYDSTQEETDMGILKKDMQWLCDLKNNSEIMFHCLLDNLSGNLQQITNIYVSSRRNYPQLCKRFIESMNLNKKSMNISKEPKLSDTERLNLIEMNQQCKQNAMIIVQNLIQIGKYIPGYIKNLDSKELQSRIPDSTRFDKCQTGGRVSFPIEYYGGDSGNYSAGNTSAGGNVPVPRGSSGVVQTGGRVSFPIEYYGGDSGNYSASNKVLDWSISSNLTPHGPGQVGGGKIPVIDHPIYGNILKTVGILSISPDMLVPLSVLVFAYELFLKKKYGSVINDPVLDKTLKGVGILSMHPLGLVPLGLITTQTLLKRSIAKNKAKRAIIGKYVNKSKSNKGSKGSKGSKGKK